MAAGEARLEALGAPKATALVGRGDTQAEGLWRAAGLSRRRRDRPLGTFVVMTLESRDRWVRAAEGWEKQADKFGKDSMPVSARMVDAIAPQPGHRSSTWRPGSGTPGSSPRS